MALADIPLCEINDLWQGDFSFLALYDLYARASFAHRKILLLFARECDFIFQYFFKQILSLS